MPQHTPPLPSRHSGETITAIRPTCPDPKYECTWAFDAAEGQMAIKLINGGCKLHNGSQPEPEPAPDLATWLVTGAA